MRSVEDWAVETSCQGGVLRDAAWSIDEALGTLLITVKLEGLVDASGIAVDLSHNRLTLEAPGFRTLHVDLDQSIKLEAVETVRWLRKSQTLSLRLPIAAGGSSCASTASSMTSATAAERVVKGSGGIVLANTDVFDPVHGSSQAILEWLRFTARPKGWLQGQKVLDYGCGSGVLGFCALMHGATSVIGVDLDRKALKATLENADANGLTERVEVRLPPLETRTSDFNDFHGNFEEEWQMEAAKQAKELSEYASLDLHEDGCFGCVIVNMRKNALLRCARNAVAFCKPGGVVVVSGFMMDFEERAVLQSFRSAGLSCQVSLDALRLEDMGDLRAHQGYGMFWGVRVCQ